MIRLALDRLRAWIWPLVGAALLASHAAAFGAAWSWRGDREAAQQVGDRDRVQRQIFDAAEALSRTEYDLRLREDAQRARSQEHDRAVLTDPRACLVPQPDDLRGLRSRWGADGASAD
ncbi:hypothetical protein [Pararhodobacter sp.]|uniref:hypothetical protein n=1 Tax=Pararhodobacter sp. TaxID=2127056 RepID=UPI002AFF45B3|nr:hypothetical protein [Pararhodobacter sp.]